MAETVGVNILKRAHNMEVSPQFDGYSGVRIFVGTDDDGNAVTIEAGNAEGRVLEIKNPFGTQEMANNILADIQGYQYQPMSAETAQLDPSAEMGDGVSVNGVYSGIFVRATQFGRRMASDISAPTDEEIEHEFAVETPTDRQYTRFVQQTKGMLKITNLAIEAEVQARQSADQEITATLLLHANQIQAKVSKKSPDGQTSFGWNLTDTEWTVFSGNPNNKILRAYSGGLEIKGKVSATSGDIGGFTIGANSIYSNGMSSMSSGQSTGVHVGTDGIKLGQNFSVGTDGIVYATGIRLKGTLYFLNDNGSLAGTMSAANLRTGAMEAYNKYSGWDSAKNSVDCNGSTWTTGAANGTSAKGKWDNAEDESEGVTIYGTFGGTFNAKSLALSGDGRGAPYHSLGLASRTVGGQTMKYVTWD